jgi:hypothetical protein
MMRDEREEYGEEARDVIEGLRHLARHVETPADLRSEVMARGERLLPPQRERRARWWTALAAWRPHPMAWGPVVAVAFFMAGVFVPWPRTDIPLQDPVSLERPMPGTHLLHKESIEIPPAPPAIPSQPLKQEMRQETDTARAPSEPLTTLARRAPSQVASSHRQVTVVLPTELHEQLQQEAQRRRVSMAAILHEAAEAYAQAHKRAP